MKVYASTTPTGDPCVVIERYNPGCWICSGQVEEGFFEVKDKKICKICVDLILDKNYEIEADGKC